MGKSKRIKKSVLDALREPAPMNFNKGPILPDNYPRPNRKTRRHSGRKSPDVLAPTIKWKELTELAIEPQEYWDDWIDYRDGFRDHTRFRREKGNVFCSCGPFNNQICERCYESLNNKLKKQLLIRKAKKFKEMLRNDFNPNQIMV